MAYILAAESRARNQSAYLPRAPLLPETGHALNLATYEAAQLPAPTFPGSAQTVPHQERGTRHRL